VRAIARQITASQPATAQAQAAVLIAAGVTATAYGFIRHARHYSDIHRWDSR
jgi:hypothetical protein